MLLVAIAAELTGLLNYTNSSLECLPFILKTKQILFASGVSLYFITVES